MKIFITGISGLLGKRLVEGFLNQPDFQISGVYQEPSSPYGIKLDITDQPRLKKVITDFSPEIIIHTAALTYVDYCEDHPAEAFNINVNGTANLVESARELNAKLIYISTDYVFDGVNGPYRETDPPNPINYYGYTKWLGEEAIRKNLTDYLIIRTVGLYDWDPESKNFVMQLINRLAKGEIMKVPDDQYGNPTLARNLAECIRELIGKGKQGTYHIVGPDNISRYQFAVESAEILGLALNLLKPVSTVELTQSAKRPLKGGLITEKARQELEIKLVGVQEGIRLVKERMSRMKEST